MYATNWANWTPLAEGARNQLWAATADKAAVVNGGFYEPVGVLGTHSGESQNEQLAGELWEWTQKELEGYAA